MLRMNNEEALKRIIKKYAYYKVNKTPLFIDNQDTRSPDVRVITIDYVGAHYARGHSEHFSEELGTVKIPATILYSDLICKSSNKSMQVIAEPEVLY